MKFWIDHTSLNSTHLCSIGRGRGELDVSDFLQLSIKLIYSEKLFVSGYGSENIIGKTRETINLYADHGLERNAIQIINLSEQDFANICHNAASAALQEFEISLPDFLDINRSDAKTLHPALGSNERHGYKLLESLLSKNMSPHDLEEMALYDLSERAWGQVIYTIYSQPKLFQLIKRSYPPTYWNQESVYGLAALMRCYQNEQLAYEGETFYAPAVSRAYQQRRTAKIIFDRLETVLTEAERDLLPKGLEVPSVKETIVSRAKGDRYGVIDETIYLRNLAKDLRSWLAKRMENADITAEDGIHQLNSEISELSIALERQLNPHKRPSLIKSLLDFQLVFFVPLPNLNSLEEWLGFKLKCKHLSVLTELSKSMAYRGSTKNDYMKLLKGCTAHLK
jgi:hypothetical protein